MHGDRGLASSGGTWQLIKRLKKAPPRPAIPLLETLIHTRLCQVHRLQRHRSRGRGPCDDTLSTRQERGRCVHWWGKTPRHCRCEDKTRTRPHSGAQAWPQVQPAAPCPEPRKLHPLHSLRFYKNVHIVCVHACVCTHTYKICKYIYIKRERKKDNYIL